tara:strand:- start:51 stop:227 length:177 start_codon:yes stop_codon:yes gene_type:complete
MAASQITQETLFRKNYVRQARKKSPMRFHVFPAKKLAQFCHAVLDFREHHPGQGLPPD